VSGSPSPQGELRLGNHVDTTPWPGPPATARRAAARASQAIRDALDGDPSLMHALQDGGPFWTLAGRDPAAAVAWARAARAALFERLHAEDLAGIADGG